MKHHKGFIFILFAISVEETFCWDKSEAGMKTRNHLRGHKKGPWRGLNAAV